MGIDPYPTGFPMSHPVTVLRLEARNSTPAPGTPVIWQLRTVLFSAVAPESLPSNTIPRARDPMILTFSTMSCYPGRNRGRHYCYGQPLRPYRHIPNLDAVCARKAKGLGVGGGIRMVPD